MSSAAADSSSAAAAAASHEAPVTYPGDTSPKKHAAAASASAAAAAAPAAAAESEAPVAAPLFPASTQEEEEAKEKQRSDEEQAASASAAAAVALSRVSSAASWMFDPTMSAEEIATKYPQQLPVMCEAAVNTSKISKHPLLVPLNATVVDLAAALQIAVDAKKKSIHILVNGAVPCRETLVKDLCASYADATDHILRVQFSVEGKFGPTMVSTPFGGAAGF